MSTFHRIARRFSVRRLGLALGLAGVACWNLAEAAEPFPMGSGEAGAIADAVSGLPAATPSELVLPGSAAQKFGSSQSPLHAIRADEAHDAARPSGKILRYAAKLIEQYDKDRDGQLNAEEWALMRGTPRLNDLDQDGVVTERELAERIAVYSQRRAVRLMPLSRELAGIGNGAGRFAGVTTAAEPANPLVPRPEEPVVSDATTRAKKYHVRQAQLPQGLGEWFVDKDADGDGQITMTEFSARLTEVEASQFARFDLNGDGVIVPLEFLRADENERAQQAAVAAGPGTGEPMPVEPRAAPANPPQ